MSVTYDITAKGIGIPRTAEPQARALVERHVTEIGDAYLVALVNATPRGRGPVTGRRRLFQSYEVSQQSSATTATYRIRNRTPHLRHVLRGRPAIVAAPGKVLRFQIGAVIYYRKRVGPAKANPYDRRVGAQMRGEIQRQRAALRAEIVRLLGGR